MSEPKGNSEEVECLRKYLHEIFPEHFNSLENGMERKVTFLGKGAHAAVYRVYSEKLGKEVAVKLIRNGLAGAAGDIEYAENDRFRDDGLNLGFPGLVQYYGHRETDAKFKLSSEKANFILMECCEKGDLSRLEPTKQKEFMERGFMGLLHSIVKMRNEGYVMGDVKTDNIFVREDGSLAFGDFGLMKKDADVGSRTGTDRYLPPEITFGSNAGYLERDLYALGLIVIEVMTGKHLFTYSDGELMSHGWMDLEEDYNGALAKSVETIRETNPLMAEAVSMMCPYDEKDRVREASGIIDFLEKMGKELEMKEHYGRLLSPRIEGRKRNEEEKKRKEEEERRKKEEEERKRKEEEERKRKEEEERKRKEEEERKRKEEEAKKGREEEEKKRREEEKKRKEEEERRRKEEEEKKKKEEEAKKGREEEERKRKEEEERKRKEEEAKKGREEEERKRKEEEEKKGREEEKKQREIKKEEEISQRISAVRQRGKLQRALKFVLGGLQNFFGLVKRLAQSIFSNKLRRIGDEMDSGFPRKDKGSKELL